MPHMTGLALAGAKPNSSFGDPSFPLFLFAAPGSTGCSDPSRQFRGRFPGCTPDKKIPGQDIVQ